MHIWTRVSIRFSVILAATIVVFGAGLPSHATAESWDPAFGVPGMDGETVHALVAYDGGLVACGDFTTAGGVPCNRIAFWDGVVWSPLGEGLNNLGIDLAVIGSDLYVGGLFTSAGNVPGTAYLARWDGTSWHDVGGGMNSYVFGLGVFEGQLVAGGGFVLAGSTPASRVATWDGATWQALGNGFTAGVPVPSVWCFEVFNDELIAGGRFTQSGGTTLGNVARWDGASWQPLGSGVNQPGGVTSVYDMTVYGSDLVVGGVFQVAGGITAAHLAGWDGAAWHAMTPGGFEGAITDGVTAVGIYRGDLVVGGGFSGLVGVLDSAHLARFDGSEWSGLGGGANGGVEYFLASGEDLFVTGLFTQVGALPANHVALWRGYTTWHVAIDGDDSASGIEAFPFRTIARGIEAAAAGDTVLIHDGRYTGNGNRDLNFAGKELTIASASGNADACVIDGEYDDSGTGWIIYEAGAHPGLVRIENLTLKRGSIGGIYVAAGPTEIRSCNIDSTTNGVGGLSGPTMYDCKISSCEIGVINISCASQDLYRCQFVGCEIGYLATVYDTEVYLHECEFVGNGIGAKLQSSLAYDLIDCQFRSNGCGIESSSVTWVSVIRGDFYDNSIAIMSANSNGISVIETRIENSGDVGILATDCDRLSIDNCIVVNSGGYAIKVLGLEVPTPVLLMGNSTIAYNGAGVGIAVGDDSGVQISDSIIAFNANDGLADIGAVYSNCNVFGNGPDLNDDSWNIGVDGNFSKDPLFCDAIGNDYGIAVNSPCAPTASHGLIGSGAVACDLMFVPAPMIFSAGDVFSDQGGQIRLAWYRSSHDVTGSTISIVGYDIFRRIDETAAPRPTRSGEKLLGWDYLLRVPANGGEVYQVVVPTLCDSTIANGLCESVFIVSAVTANPLEYFDSEPEGGYSVDNLAPTAPTAISASYAFDAVMLDWDDAPEPDFQVFRIYRGTDASFLPGPEYVVAESGTSEWTDHTAGSWGYHYKIAAVDFAGNEGQHAGPGSVSGADQGDVPMRTVLRGAAPNPFNPSTTLFFEIAETGHVRLRVYDPGGRLVATLIDEPRSSGRHEVIWNGRDDDGRAVASGVYLCRLEAKSYSETKRMVLVK